MFSTNRCQMERCGLANLMCTILSSLAVMAHKGLYSLVNRSLIAIGPMPDFIKSGLEILAYGVHNKNRERSRIHKAG
jgi:hypothetical protein